MRTFVLLLGLSTFFIGISFLCVQIKNYYQTDTGLNEIKRLYDILRAIQNDSNNLQSSLEGRHGTGKSFLYQYNMPLL
jgi:hypothetical protein